MGMVTVSVVDAPTASAGVLWVTCTRVVLLEPCLTWILVCDNDAGAGAPSLTVVVTTRLLPTVTGLGFRPMELFMITSGAEACAPQATTTIAIWMSMGLIRWRIIFELFCFFVCIGFFVF